MASIDDLIADFELFDDWEDRYRYLIDLGKTLEPLSEDEHSDANKVRGCASQVWLVSQASDGSAPVITFRGDSDAHIVRGLIAILISLFSGAPAQEITEERAREVFARIGLDTHLSPQRSNGLASMVRRLKTDAEAALSGV